MSTCDVTGIVMVVNHGEMTPIISSCQYFIISTDCDLLDIQHRCCWVVKKVNILRELDEKLKLSEMVINLMFLSY